MLDDGGVAGFTARRVASGADTSVPAVYELFGDKAGLLREVFFEGFRQLGARLESVERSNDARPDLERAVYVVRDFARENRVLTDVMFSQPFANFDPGPDERRAGSSVREFLVASIKRCVDAGEAVGDPTDIAHVLLALAQGLAAQENAGWLGTSDASRNRRGSLAIRALLDGFAP
jgi:AcrR family transcriptional regulator